MAQPEDATWNPYLKRCVADTPGTRRARQLMLAYFAQKDNEKLGSN